MEQNASEQTEVRRRKGLAESGLSYSVAALLSVLLSYLVSAVSSTAAGADYASKDWYLYLAYLTPQIVFCGAIAVYFVRSREPFLAPFRKTRPKYFLIAFLLQFGLLFSLSELNGLFVGFWEKMGYVSSGVSVPDLTGWRLLPALITIALLPAVCEETLFRGVLTRKMHDGGWGMLPTLLISGGLFALFHGRPEQTVYQFLCGVCFSLVALRAGSVLPTVLAHFCNNAAILVLSVFGFADFSDFPLACHISLIVCASVCLLGVLVYLLFFDKQGNRKGGVKDGAPFFLAAGGGILVCALEWIAVLVMGFTM